MMWLRNTAARLVNSDRVAGFVDQGLQSGGRLAALLLFARVLSKEDFGVLTLAMAFSYMAAGLQRALITLPFIVSCPTVDAVRERGGPWFWLNIVLIAALTAMLAAMAAALPALGAPTWLQRAVVYATVSAPAVMFYDFTRRWLYQGKDHRTIILMAGIGFLTLAAGAAWAGLVVREAWAAVLALAAASLLGALAARLRDRPPGLGGVRGMFEAWRATRAFAGWQVLASFVSQTDSRGLQLVVAALLGPVGVAVLAAVQTLGKPIGVVVSAVDMIDKPRAGRAYAKRGLAGLGRSIRGTRRLLLLLGLPYLALLLIFSGEAMALVFGPKYAGHATELRLIVATALLGLYGQPLETRMITLRRSRALFLCKLAGGITTFGVLFLLIGPYGLSGALAGVFLGRATKLVLLLVAGRIGTGARPPLPAIPFAGRAEAAAQAPSPAAPAPPRLDRLRRRGSGTRR